MRTHQPGRLTRDAIIDRLAAVEPRAAEHASRVQVVRAPGRVNLIGEHTDYNDGLVLPVAIDLETWLGFVPTEDRRVRLHSDDGPAAAIDLDRLGPRRGAWSDYVAGTAWALQAAGIQGQGFTGAVLSTLPRAAGLSSSAALELVAAWALAWPAAETIDGLELARICQRGENDFVGVQCGLMDQFAVACGRAGAGLLLDCRSLAYRTVALPEDRLSIVVCHTGSTRRLDTSGYNARRRECEASLASVVKRRPEVISLRDLTTDDLGWLASVLDEAKFRRLRHVVTENDRVLAAVAALEAGDEERLGPVFEASHASLRDDFEVSSPELDLLVAIAAATPGVIATRMTGGGFGGCTVNLVRPQAIERLTAAVTRDYRTKTGLEPRVLVVRAADGAGMAPSA